MHDHVQSAERFTRALGLNQQPVAIYYSDELPSEAHTFEPDAGWACIVNLFVKAAQGQACAADKHTSGCGGAMRQLGFDNSVREHFYEFLSCGVPGKVEGERYIRTPEIAERFIREQYWRPAPARWCVFMPWPQVPADITPEIVVLFERPDVISGLVVQADYTREAVDTTVVRFTSGCGSVVMVPLSEAESDDPHAVLGMTDISARKFFGQELLSYAVPWDLLLRMEADLGESFLIQEPWLTVRQRGENK